MSYPQSWIDAFLDKVDIKLDDPNACFEWQGTLEKGGYGLCWRYGERYAHRHSYRIFKGPIPPGMCVRHRCDNKKCVNPDHLILGSKRDNNKDAYERGLQARGSMRRPDISEEMVYEARVAFHNKTETATAIAARFGMHRTQVSDMMWGRLWCHVDMPPGVRRRARRRKLKRDRRKDK